MPICRAVQTLLLPDGTEVGWGPTHGAGERWNSCGDGDGADVGGESGDNVIPARLMYTSLAAYRCDLNEIPSDLYYAGLDGNWDADGDLIWLMPKAGLAAFSSFVLESNDSKEYTENWSMVNENGTPWLLDDDFPAEPGTYDIVGSLHPILLAQEDKDKYVPISVSIDVIR